MILIPVLLELVTLHTVDGHAVRINPAQVTQLIEPRGKGQITKTVNCIVRLTDGSYVSTAETCAQVQEVLREPEPGTK